MPWRIFTRASATDEGNLLALHPTVKPVAMVAKAFYSASSPVGGLRSAVGSFASISDCVDQPAVDVAVSGTPQHAV